ncbi:gluconokinase [Amnibacterium flavum]|uniref:Gluconokinase n=1 Tax=Amnibacterium flavum TaxID=2173173 RepID=A0A2V1HMB5_9MICO|nr:gluconokinase [Amnibacterium flavum]PVZ93678.1 gluconate kinase [Amnibacterium flavum]
MPSRPIVVMGVSGSGKSTIGALLAERLDDDFVDADDLHPAANKAKMTAGIPLDDADRLPWLRAVGKTIATDRDLDRGIVVACSSLKRAYRDIIRDAVPTVLFVYLDGTPELLARRMGARTGHFMPTALLTSQLAILEPLEADEVGVTVDVDQSPEAIVDSALASIGAID